MKKILLFILLIFFISVNCYGHGNGLADTYVHLGKGCTTAYYIDDDCDGYGVGYGLVLGPDADDTDATVNTSATAIAHSGTMEAFIKAKYQTYTGLTDGGILRFAVVDDVNGVDATGVWSTSLATAMANPYKSLYSGAAFLATTYAGDCIVFRGPTYPNQIFFGPTGHGLHNGTETNPSYIIGYPGEQVHITGTGCAFNGNDVSVNPSKWHIIDGFVVKNIVGSTTIVDCHYAENLTIRECWFGGHSFSYQNKSTETKYLKFERNVFAEYHADHTLYITGHAIYGDPTSGRTISPIIRGNIFYSTNQYNSGWPVLQFNGGQNDVLIENNIFHSMFGANNTITFANATTGALIQNNIFFNSETALNVYWYRTGDPRYNIPQLGITDVKFINNTIFIPAIKPDSSVADRPAIFYIRYDMILDRTGSETWPIPTWTPLTTFADTSYHLFTVPTVANDCSYGLLLPGTGTASTAASEPVWPTVSGQTVVDGGITWQAFCNDQAMTDHVIRNNIFYMVGSSQDSIIKFSQIWPDLHSSREMPIIENNVIYRVANTSRMLGTYEVGGGGAYTYYDFAAFESYDTDNGFPNNIKNNINADPLFIHIDITRDLAQTGTFNLEVSPGSPSIASGLATDMPATDIRGTTRVGNDIGAYEYGGGAPVLKFRGFSSQGASFR